MEKILRYKAIETNQSVANQTRIFFPDQPDLRGAKIHSIEIYTSQDISVSPQTYSGMPTAADIGKAFLVMFQQAERKVDHMPLVSLHNLSTPATTGGYLTVYSWDKKEFKNFTPSWDKCYVELASAISAASLVFSFGVYYTLDTDKI